MYQLMKSEKFTLDPALSGLMSSYRQTEIGYFEQFPAAHEACEVANTEGKSHHYVLNELGQEYYNGVWID